MKTFFLISSLTVALGSSAFAGHTNYLHGMIHIPGIESALIETQYSFPGPPNRAAKTSRLVRAGESFEDKTIKDSHFQFQVLDIDWATQTLKTREAGEERTYTLPPPPQRPANAPAWLQLRKADFYSVVDLYGDLEGRTVLLHPKLQTGPVTFQTAWTNPAPTKVQAAEALAALWTDRGAAVVRDGTQFIQIVPAELAASAKAKSAELPSDAATPGSISFQQVDAASVVQVYAAICGRQLTGTVPNKRTALYLRATTQLSKPEALYGLETLLAWNGLKIVPGADNTFSVESIRE